MVIGKDFDISDIKKSSPNVLSTFGLIFKMFTQVFQSLNLNISMLIGFSTSKY